MRTARRVGFMAVFVATAALLGGCSLVGKRDIVDNTGRPGWQLSILNARGFQDSEGKYVFAVYDHAVPQEKSLSLLQLWSGSRKGKK